MSAIEVRRARPDDWATVRGVRLAALREAPYAFGSTYAREVEFDEQRWRDWIGEPTDRAGCVFLAYDGGRAVGMDGAFRNDDGDAHLIAMWVDPAARRAGIGAALTTAVIDWARANDMPHVKLDVAADNASAIALYESLGFVATGAARPLHSDPSRLALEYVLPLRR